MSPNFYFGIAFAHSTCVKLIVEESTMQNQVIEIAWAKSPGLSEKMVKAAMLSGQISSAQTRFTGDAACDWHGICNNAGCPTIVDWRAI